MHDLFYGHFYTIICVVQSARTRVRRRVVRRLIWIVAACHPPCRDIFRIEWKYYAAEKEKRYMQYTYQHVIFIQSSSFSLYRYLSFNERWVSGVFCVHVIHSQFIGSHLATRAFPSITNSMSRVIARENHAHTAWFVENQRPWKFVNEY